MKKIQLIAFWMAMLSLSSCSESLCDDPFSASDGAEITLRQGVSLRYEVSPGNWQSMIGINGIYRLDSVQITDEAGNPCVRCKKDSQGVDFTFADKNSPRGVDLVTTHYLYLTYQDTDTLRHEFKINDSNCKKRLAYGRFFYNNQLIESSKNENGIPFASVVK